MNLKYSLDNQSGHSLLEVLAAGMILMILGLMTLKGFGISEEFLLRGNALVKQMEETQQRIELERPPSDKRKRTLMFSTKTGETAQLKVTEKIYEIRREDGKAELSWRIVIAGGE